MQEKVISRKHPHGDMGGCVITPAFKLLARNVFILQPAKDCDGAVKRRSGLTFIRLTNLKVRTKYGS